MSQSVKVVYRLGVWWRDSREGKMWKEQRLRCLRTSSRSIFITSRLPGTTTDPARAGRSFVMSLSGSWLKILFLVAVKSCANILWFTQTASKISLFFQPSAFWTNSRGIPKQSVGALRQESSSSLCVGLSTPPLLLCLWGFRPASAHVNLAKYREFDCNVSIAAPLVLLSRLSVGWMKAWLLGKQSLVSFTDESSSCPPYLSLLTLSEAERTRCSEQTSTGQNCPAPTLPVTGPQGNHLFRSFYAHQCELVSV